jgi:hypothetical protein
VRRAQAEIATIDGNPQQPLRHTAALVTWGNAPSNFQSTSAWSRFQNWREWMEEGYLDAGIPMTYYNEGVYPTWYRNWVDQEMIWRYDRHIFVGPGIYLNTFGNSITQMTYAQNAGADGLSSYSYASTYNGGTDWSWYSYVASNLFTGSASPPDMPWRDPAAATEGTVYGRVTDGSTGEPIDDATIKVNGFPTVQTDGNGFYIITQLSAGPSGTLLPLSAGYSGYADAQRPAVLVERASFTEANFALGNWLPGDYDVDADVDLDDYKNLDACQTGPEGGPLAAGCDLFDFDVDADVDLEDHQVFQESFGG